MWSATVGALPSKMFRGYSSSAMDTLFRIAEIDLHAAELAAICFAEHELAAARLDNGSPVLELFKASRPRRPDGFRSLTEMFSRNAPREIFRMFEGRTADTDREAIILKNFVGHDTEHWWHFCHEEILDAVFGEGSYSSRTDTSVPTIARCLKKVLSGTISPETYQAVALTFATHGSTTISEACWKALKSLPVSESNVSMLEPYSSYLSKKASLRLLTWLGSAIDKELTARSYVGAMLESDFEEVRTQAATSLLPNITPADITPTLVAMAYGEDMTAQAITSTLTYELLDERLRTEVLPSFTDGTLSPVARSYLPAWIGRNGPITSAFMALLLDIEQNWDDDSEWRLEDLMMLLQHPRAILPKAMWALLQSSIGRAEPTYSVPLAFCHVILAHPDASEGHDVLMRLLVDASHIVDATCSTAARLAEANSSFRSRLICSINSGEFSPRTRLILLEKIALVGTHDGLQALVAEAVEDEIASRSEGHHPVFDALGYIDWSNRLVSAVEKLREGSPRLREKLQRLLQTRVPGTAKVYTNDRQSMLDAAQEARRQQSSPLALPPAEIRTSPTAFLEYFDFSDDPDEEGQSLKRTGAGGRSPSLVWLGNYVFDPHPGFWNHMPDELLAIRIVSSLDPDGRRVPGSEALELSFRNKSTLHASLTEFLDVSFVADALPLSGWGVHVRGYGSDYRQRHARAKALGIIRANIGLLCRISRDDTCEAEFETKRPRKVPSERLGSSEGAGNLIQYHPHLFFKIYGETSFADAYDLNSEKVFKRAPCERVVPGFGLPSGEEGMLTRDLLFMERITFQWLRDGAYVVDLGHRPDLHVQSLEGKTLRASSNLSMVYVSMGSGAVGGTEVDGFYVQYSPASDRTPAGYFIVFTHVRRDRSPVDLVGAAWDISAYAHVFIASGTPLDRAVATRLVPNVSHRRVAPRHEDVVAAANILHLMQNGTKREIRARDQGYIPIPLGRNSRSGQSWLAEKSPICTYYPLQKKIVSLGEARRPVRQVHRNTILIEDRPDPMTTETIFLVEDHTGCWKRVKRGDWRGANGDVCFPDLAGSKRRVMEVAAYMTGRKVSGLRSIRPRIATFDRSGSLRGAIDGFFSLNDYLEMRDGKGGPLEWEVTSDEIASVTALLLAGRRSDMLG